jgi:hypothetical protein
LISFTRFFSHGGVQWWRLGGAESPAWVMNPQRSAAGKERMGERQTRDKRATEAEVFTLR